MTGSPGIRIGSVTVVRAVAGCAWLLAAPAVADHYGSPLRRPVLWGARLLGARHLVEAAALGTADSPALRRGIALVDAAHGSSMVLLAARSRSLRPVAVSAAAEALALAITTYPSASRRERSMA
jgi:hypothetical protein